MDLQIGGNPIREWIGPDGHEWVAMAPYALAIRRELRREGVERPTMEEVEERAREYTSDLRELPSSLLDEIADAESLQRENGYEGV